MTRLVKCPYCEQMVERRTVPLTEEQCLRAHAALLVKGWTPERLLEQADTLDHLAPGFADYLRAVVQR